MTNSPYRIVVSSGGGKCCPAFRIVVDDSGSCSIPDDFGHWGCKCTVDINVEDADGLTVSEISIGVELVEIDGSVFKDFTVPIQRALDEAIANAPEVRHMGLLPSMLRFNTRNEFERLTHFHSLVNHHADWDIKREGSWNRTIGENTFPEAGTQVYAFGLLMTPENLGNFTYGYLGAALNIPLRTLYMGSAIAAHPLSGLDSVNDVIRALLSGSSAQTTMSRDDWANEFGDWEFIREGFDYFRNQ